MTKYINDAIIGGGAITTDTLPLASTVAPGTFAWSSQLGPVVASNGIWNPLTPPTPNRLPTLADNTALGFTTASIWQAGGTLYTPGAYCAKDSAAWAPLTQSAAGTAADIMGTTLTKFAGGTVAMLKDYVGAAIDVAITIGGVYQIFTVSILATGELDNIALGAAMANADAGTYAKVLKVYDQTGNGNHAALGTATGIPAVVNATVTASTTLTVNSVTSGAVVIGQLVYANGIPPGVTIASGTGPYVLSAAAALNPGPEAMYLGITTPPYIDWDPLMGRYALQSPAELTQTSTLNQRALQFPQTMTITSSRNFGVYAVGPATSTADANAPVVVSVGDNNVAPNNSETIVGSGSLTVAGQSTSGQFGLADNGNLKLLPLVKTTQPMVLLMQTAAAGNTITAYVNENVGTSTSALNSNALAGGWLFTKGFSGLTPYGMMKLIGLAIFNAAPTAAQGTALRNAAYARFNIYPQVQNAIALVGDSRFAGHEVSPGFGISEFLPRMVGRNWDIFNLSVSSLQLATMVGDGLVPTITGIAFSLATVKRPGNNIAIVMAGVNDFILGAKTVAQVLALLKTLCAQIKAAGWTPILVAEMACTTATNNANTSLPLLNAAIMAQGAAAMNAAALINLYQYVPVTTPTNTAFYYDGLHPTSGVHEIIASAVALAIAPF